MQQYGAGPFHICDWADIVTVHLVAGATVVTSLKEASTQQVINSFFYSPSANAKFQLKSEERGILLIAQMSTADAASKQEGNASQS